MNLILLLFLFNIPNIFCLTWSQSFDNFPSSWKTAKIGGQNLYLFSSCIGYINR